MSGGHQELVSSQQEPLLCSLWEQRQRKWRTRRCTSARSSRHRLYLTHDVAQKLSLRFFLRSPGRVCLQGSWRSRVSHLHCEPKGRAELGAHQRQQNIVSVEMSWWGGGRGGGMEEEEVVTP